MNPESFEKKLFIPRDVEGTPNTQELEVIREVEKKFSTHQAFVGAIPFGSTVRGYSTEHSDIDIKILFDPSRLPNQDQKTVFKEIELLSQEAKKEIERKISKKAQFMIIAVNFKLLKSALESRNYYPILEIANLCRLVTGKIIDEYRKELSNMFRNLPDADQINILQRVIGLLEEEEKLSFEKLSTRHPELKERKKEILQARTELWLHRVHDILYGTR